MESDLNQLLFKFRWNGVDKVTRVPAINDYERGGLKLIDVDCMIRSLRLGWQQRVLNDSNATWKRYFLYLLEHVRGIFFLSFDVKDFKLPCPFYYELLQWWSEFRDTFAEENDYKNIILSNKEIKIDNKPVYFKNYREPGITYSHDLLFDRDINVALSSRTRKVNKINFLQWAGLRHSISSQLRYANVPLSTLSPSFTFENNTFDIRRKRSKDYYSLLVSRKANIPISPSNCRGILILQSIKSIKSSYYHLLLHLNLM